jgi:probable rRNA maturation factor
MTGAFEIVVPCRRWLIVIPEAERLCGRFARAALAVPALCQSVQSEEASALSIALADDAMARDLNHRFRGIDKPTNVLSFPARETGAAIGANAAELGDILVAYETTVAEAEDQGIPVADHLAHLVIHGVLHLRGFDHQRPGDAEAMEAIETELLARFGIADPYCEPLAESAR